MVSAVAHGPSNAVVCLGEFCQQRSLVTSLKYPNHSSLSHSSRPWQLSYLHFLFALKTEVHETQPYPPQLHCPGGQSQSSSIPGSQLVLPGNTYRACLPNLNTALPLKQGPVLPKLNRKGAEYLLAQPLATSKMGRNQSSGSRLPRPLCKCRS